MFFAEAREKDRKLVPKRPSTATVRKLKKLKNEESEEDEDPASSMKSLLLDFELKVAQAASVLSVSACGSSDGVEEGPAMIPASSFIDLGARALFVGAFEELVRLEHVTDRGDLLLVASADLLTMVPAGHPAPAPAPAPSEVGNENERPEEHANVAAMEKKKKGTTKPVVPRVFVSHPDGAAASLSALTGRLLATSNKPAPQAGAGLAGENQGPQSS